MTNIYRIVFTNHSTITLHNVIPDDRSTQNTWCLNSVDGFYIIPREVIQYAKITEEEA
jgi:hypothetical protein